MPCPANWNLSLSCSSPLAVAGFLWQPLSSFALFIFYAPLACFAFLYGHISAAKDNCRQGAPLGHNFGLSLALSLRLRLLQNDSYTFGWAILRGDSKAKRPRVNKARIACPLKAAELFLPLFSPFESLDEFKISPGAFGLPRLRVNERLNCKDFSISTILHNGPAVILAEQIMMPTQK